MVLRTSLRVVAVLTSLLTVSLFAQAQADFGVSKIGPSSAAAGTDVTYAVQVVNAGPDDADVRLDDVMPTGMTFVSFTQDPAFSCSTPAVGTNGTVSCTNATMVAGSNANFTFTFHIPPSAVPGDTFNNVATVSTSAADPNDENNTATASTTVPSPDADAGVLKTGPGSAPPGSNVVYTISVFNSGPSDATTVQMNDTLPGTMTFVSLSQSGPAFSCSTPSAGAGGTITCNLATLTAGSTTTFTLTANIPGGTVAGTTFDNTATVKSDVDPNPDNNTASSLLTVTSADPAITKSGPASATGGQTITYTINLVNNGSDVATNVHWIDTLPSQTTFNALTNNSGSVFSCTTPPPGFAGTIDCFLNNFGGSATSNYTLILNVDPAFANGATLTNAAFVTSDNDVNTSNNSSSTSATVTGVTDVSVAKSGPANANAGSNITWTLTVTNNNGANAAANTSLTDTLPGGTTFVSFNQNSGPSFSCSGTSSITCTNASFAAGATATFTLVASTSPSATGSVSNTATVSTTTSDSNAGNNSSTANTTLTASADVVVTKSGPATAVQNQDVSYTIGVTNNGPSNAQSVSLSDTVPAQATFVSMNQNTGPAFNCSGTTTVTCTIATLSAGASATFTLTVHTNASVSGGMLNTANVSSTTSDPNPANNSASAATNIVTADIAVSKSGSPATVAAGGNVTWTIVVTNNGPGDASNVAMTDALPPNTTFVSINQSGPAFNCTTPAVGANGTVTCTIATLTNGASTTFTLVAQTAQSTPAGTLSNTANAAATSPLDPTPGNNVSTSSTTIVIIDLSLNKTVSSGPYFTGQPVTFTLTVTNNGAAPATNVVVTDVLPAGMFASGTTPAGACSGTSTVTCTAATLAAGASTAFNITATLPATPGNYSNTATVTSANGDSAPANNSSTAGFAVALGTPIPTLDPMALLLFAALLGLAAFVTLKR